MKKNRGRHVLAVALLCAGALCLPVAPAHPAPATPPAFAPAAGQADASPEGASPPAGAAPPAPVKPHHIVQLFGSRGPLNGTDSAGNSIRGSVGLNDELRVAVAPEKDGQQLGPIDAKDYALFLNGREVKRLAEPVYDRAQHSLVFLLQRNRDNKELWTLLLGSPRSWTVPVTVSLGERPKDASGTLRATITGIDHRDELELDVLPPWRIAIGLAIIAAGVALTWAHARRRSTLRDNLLPQLAPSLQPYSLGRWQMAFWFTLIFASFVLLFLLLWDSNTISAQALTLMGISGGTALAAVGVDAYKDSPADRANRGLQALGLHTFADVERVRWEIAEREKMLASHPHHAHAHQLQSEIQDRHNILLTYEARTRPFITQGWYKDLTTDLNGPAIHRLQVFCWTWVLGAVFLIGVWRDLSMPDFSSTLLALMGISSAGYVGFKFPEANN